MRKFKLDLEKLRVESFAVTPESREDGGTVFAHSETRRSEEAYECTMETFCGGTVCGEEVRPTGDFTTCQWEDQPGA